MTAKETLLMEGVKDPNFGMLTGTMPVILSAMESYAKQEAIAFNEWCEKLSAVQRCTVWPPAGSGSGTGLYEQTTENLYETYLRLKTKKKKK